MKKKITLLVLSASITFQLILTVFESRGQAQNQEEKKGNALGGYLLNSTPNAPGQAALGTFGNFPINYYTGLPEVSLNLFTLTSRDLSLPISLNFDASGLRLEEFSGPVGLKWNLDAGGFIARSVNGLPDEDPVNGYFQHQAELNASTINHSAWTTYSEQNTRDTEPDEYVLYIGGRSIKFFLDNGLGVPIPKQDVKITFVKDANQKLYQFIVVTEDGIEYTFGGTSTSVEERKVDNLNLSGYYYYKVHNDLYNVNINSGQQNEVHVAFSFYVGNEKLGSFQGTEKPGTFYNSKWHLVSIKSPASDEITFKYIKLANQEYVTTPSVSRRKAVLFNKGNYTYTDNYCTARSLGVCTNHQNLTFNHGAPTSPPSNPPIPPLSPYLTPAYASFDKSATNLETVVRSAISDQYFDPHTYPVIPEGYFYSQSFITESVIHLDAIETKAGNKIIFTPSSREDVSSGKKFDRIQLKNLNGTIVKDIALAYETVGPTTTSDWWLIENWAYQDPLPPNILVKYLSEMIKPYNYKRLYLQNVQQIMNDGTSHPLYAFDYTGRGGFRRNSYYQNVLGLGTTNFAINHERPSIEKLTGDGNFFSSKIRKISYPTGGSTEFTYDAPNGSGRLATMVDRNDDNEIVSQKSLLVLESFTLSTPLMATTQYYSMSGSTTHYSATTMESSYPQNRSFALTHGVYAANKKVRVYNGTSTSHNGYEEFVFRTDGDLKTPVFTGSTSTLDNVSPFPKNKQRDYLRGLLDEHIVFDKDGNKIMKEKNFYELNDVLIENYNEDNPVTGQYTPQTILGFSGGSLSFQSSGLNKTSRYARYKVGADKVEKVKTITTIYDQSLPRDESKVFTKVEEFSYSSQNGLISGTTTYNQANPSSKVETYIRYVTDANYNPPAGNLTPEAAAINLLKIKHQFSAPVEQGTIFREGSSFVRGPTVIYKYKYGSVIKPYQILGMAKTAGAYLESSIDGTGAFKIDNSASTIFRVMHTYDSYDANGNILEQTSLDGIKTKYIWGHNNTLVTNQIVNPHPSAQHESVFTHVPLVGVISIRDPNLLLTSYNYDKSNRLMNSTRYDGKIVNRYKYHYKNGSDYLTASLQATGSFTVGTSMNIQTPAEVRDRGAITYTWNFGDGSTSTTSYPSVNHTFSSANTFNVSVVINHPEYGSATASIPVKINPTLVSTICVNGALVIKNCNGTLTQFVAGSCGSNSISTTQVNVTPSGGSGQYTYKWEYQVGSGGWQYLESTSASSGAPFSFKAGTVGNYNVRCTITDSNGNIIYSAITLVVFNSCS